MTKAHGLRQGQKSFSHYSHRQNRLDFGKRSLINCQSKSEQDNEKRANLKHLPQTPPFFPDSASLLISSPHLPERRWGMGLAVSSSHIVLPAPLSSVSSHSCPAPVWCPSHRSQSSMNFSNLSPSHRPQFFMNCSSSCPPWGHKSCQQTCSGVVSSHHGAKGPARTLLHCGLPMG